MAIPYSGFRVEDGEESVWPQKVSFSINSRGRQKHRCLSCAPAAVFAWRSVSYSEYKHWETGESIIFLTMPLIACLAASLAAGFDSKYRICVWDAFWYRI